MFRRQPQYLFLKVSTATSIMFITRSVGFLCASLIHVLIALNIVKSRSHIV